MFLAFRFSESVRHSSNQEPKGKSTVNERETIQGLLWKSTDNPKGGGHSSHQVNFGFAITPSCDPDVDSPPPATCATGLKHLCPYYARVTRLISFKPIAH